MNVGAAIRVLRQAFVLEGSKACDVLLRCGEAAFGPLLAAIDVETDEDALRELRRALSLMSSRVPLARYAQALSHRSPHVRSTAAYTLQMAGDDAVPFAADVLPLLADLDDDVRQRGIWAFGGIGQGAVPVLQQVRRHGPGRLRAGALEALATIGGEDALDVADRAAVQRLIRVKLINETPSPPHLCGSWLAISTGDQNAVIRALDLSDAQPVTMALGFSAVSNDHHHWGKEFETRRGRAFVTPQFGPWTLVFGGWYAHDEPDQYPHTAVDTCNRLSHTFGRAHAYGTSCGDGWMSWCISENGTLRRYYEVDNPDTAFGDLLPIEQGRLLPDDHSAYTDAFWADARAAGDPHRDPSVWAALRRQHHIPDDVDVLDVSAAMSINPATFGPTTTFHGHGLLTLNEIGRQHGVCPGPLAI